MLLTTACLATAQHELRAHDGSGHPLSLQLLSAEAPEALPAPPGAGVGPLFSAPPGNPQQRASDCVGCESAIGGNHRFLGVPQNPQGDEYRHWWLDQMDLRHSNTHGRAMGPGGPLRGTSWKNRPYWVSFDVGGLLMTDRPAANVRSNNDLLGAIGVGWDWDHYWGVQARVAWATPELLNTTQTSLDASDNFFIGDLSALYYPWGDSRLRPYYRIGVGLTDIEYFNDNGFQVQESLFTIPFGVGLKYQFRRWMTLRLEIMDNLAFGTNETDTMGNLTITTGLEWRYGGRPSGYWAWAGRGGAW